ncbi:MAG: lycopene cyclase family protein [Sandaracinaceae bacterium]|nr:lycopene cyclase family protein [Sandaracinaceae bacterium]
MTEKADIVILGAGASGLSLAMRLAQSTTFEVLLLEARSDPSLERTFSFFEVEAHPFHAALSHRYHRIRVRSAASDVVSVLHRHPYVVLPGEAFVDTCLRQIETSPRVRIRWNCRVQSVTECRDQVLVDTTHGTIAARLVVDARGTYRNFRSFQKAQERPEVCWLQHFLGLRVRTENPIFDPKEVILMDFAPPQPEGVRFIYVLPEAPDRALVEDTFFSSTPGQSSEYEAGIAQWLTDRGAGRFDILGRERGCIPMTTIPQPPHLRGRILPFGLRGGAAKPSTGYAFLFIQRQAEALTRALLRHGLDHPHVLSPPHPPLFRILDRIFLSYIAHHPKSAPSAFTALFERVSGDRLARFLSESASPRDVLSVLSALPPLPLLREAYRSRHLWMRLD